MSDPERNYRWSPTYPIAARAELIELLRIRAFSSSDITDTPLLMKEAADVIELLGNNVEIYADLAREIRLHDVLDENRRLQTRDAKWRRSCESLESRIDALKATLSEILGTFTEKRSNGSIDNA